MTFWTDERTDLLKRLWPQGLSNTETAKRIGSGCTKNMVCTKARRLGLSRNAASQPPLRGDALGGGS
jgi:GcrA cell cycle regulator